MNKLQVSPTVFMDKLLLECEVGAQLVKLLVECEVAAQLIKLFLECEVGEIGRASCRESVGVRV
jgi:hypothetical protein